MEINERILQEGIPAILNFNIKKFEIYDKFQDERIKVNYSYPNDSEYDYEANLSRINFDEEYIKDLSNNQGFRISNPTTLKKDIKDPNGIFSTKFGHGLNDTDAFIDRYSCPCGATQSKFNDGIECPVCHQLCKFVDDDFKMFGWIKLADEYPIIHPDIYKQLDYFFGRSKFDKKSKNKNRGSKLKNILDYDIQLDVNGHEIKQNIAKPDEPFYGKGFLFFINNFDEIIEYYHQKYPKKEAVYRDIMADRDLVFTHSIPVYTSHLRATNIEDGNMHYEKCTGMYNMMVKLAAQINKKRTISDKAHKVKSQELFNLQMKYMELDAEILRILSGKHGELRMLVGGRYNFSSRCVIIQDPTLRIDQVKLPYAALVILLKGQIENILHRMYNISYQEAYNKWYAALSQKDPIILEIIKTIIYHSGKDPITNNYNGLEIIINRNPSIAFGSILQCFCIGINEDDYTMSISLQVLKLLAADYDKSIDSYYYNSILYNLYIHCRSKSSLIAGSSLTQYATA